MTIFICSYDVRNNFLNTTQSTELFEVFYKSQNGPLGFNIDYTSAILFRKIVEGTIWFSKYNFNFNIMNEEYLNANKLLGFDGLFIFPNQYIINDIDKEKKKDGLS